MGFMGFRHDTWSSPSSRNMGVKGTVFQDLMQDESQSALQSPPPFLSGRHTPCSSTPNSSSPGLSPDPLVCSHWHPETCRRETTLQIPIILHNIWFANEKISGAWAAQSEQF